MSSENISLWEGVWSSKANTYNKATITENISIWEGVMVSRGPGGIQTVCQVDLDCTHFTTNNGNYQYFRQSALFPLI